MLMQRGNKSKCWSSGASATAAQSSLNFRNPEQMQDYANPQHGQGRDPFLLSEQHEIKQLTCRPLLRSLPHFSEKSFEASGTFKRAATQRSFKYSGRT